MKILVIDDEAKQCRGIKGILERHYPEYIIEGHTTITDAKKAILENDITIVVSDINMPEMDGLAFAEWILSKSPTTKVIFLTGYAEFDFAQKAIHIGAFDFLVKPLNPKILINAVEKAILKSQAEQGWRKQNPTKYHSCYLEEADLKFLSNEGMGAKNGLVIATRLNWQKHYDEKILEENELLKRQVQSAFNEGSSTYHAFTYFSKKELGIMLTIVLVDVNVQDESLQRSEISKLIKENFPASLINPRPIHGLSSFAEHLLAELDERCEEAVKSLEYAFYFPKALVLQANHIPKIVDETINQSASERYPVELTKMIQFGDFEGTKAVIDEFVAALIESGYPHPNSLKKIFFDLLERLGQELDCSLAADELNQILAAKEFEVFLDHVRSVIREMIQIQLKKNRQGQPFKSLIDHYLEENSSKDITLNDVADYFNLAPSYCSYLISEETGVSFSKHLLLKRITKACSLLKKGKLRIYEVSQAVGYNDVKYFTRVFKREIGMTPQQYREAMMRKNHEKT